MPTKTVVHIISQIETAGFSIPVHTEIVDSKTMSEMRPIRPSLDLHISVT